MNKSKKAFGFGSGVVVGIWCAAAFLYVVGYVREVIA
jgi:hypothetical protein